LQLPGTCDASRNINNINNNTNNNINNNNNNNSSNNNTNNDDADADADNYTNNSSSSCSIFRTSSREELFRRCLQLAAIRIAGGCAAAGFIAGGTLWYPAGRCGG